MAYFLGLLLALFSGLNGYHWQVGHNPFNFAVMVAMGLVSIGLFVRDVK